MANESSAVGETPSLADYSQYLLYVSAGSVIALGNVLVLLAILARPSLRRRKELLFIAGLAFGDLLFGLAQVVSGARRLHVILAGERRSLVHPWDCMLKPGTPIWFAAYYVQGAMMLVLSVDRYLAIARFGWWRVAGRRYPTLVFALVGGHALLGLVAAYATSASMPAAAVANALCHVFWAVPQWYSYYVMSFSASTGYLSVVVYGFVVYEYRKRSNLSFSDKMRQKQLQRQRDLTKTVGIVAAFTFFCYCTYYGGILLVLVWVDESLLFARIVSYLSISNTINATVNIVIYCWRQRDIRASLARLLGFSNDDAAAMPPSPSAAPSAKPNHGSIKGKVDEIKKLHIRPVPLGETARRIAHQPETQSFAIVTCRYEVRGADGQIKRARPSVSTTAPSTSQSWHAAASTRTADEASGESSSAGGTSDEGEVETHSVVVLGQQAFDTRHSHELGRDEQAVSLLSGRLADDPNPYYIVGTALILKDESEAKLGRLIVFQYTAEGKFIIVAEKELKGCPNSMALLNGKLLVAVNSAVRLFEWTSERELRLECSHFNFIQALYLKTKGDFVLAGDLMRSVCVLAYKQIESCFDEIARDYTPNWMTGVEMIDDDTYLGAENSFNLFTCQKDSAATTDDDRQRLQEVGMWHLGEMVNVLRHGSLVSQQPTGEAAPPLSTPVLFGTVEGAVGLVGQLPSYYHKFLGELEARLANAWADHIGRIEHSVWRAFYTERKSEAANGFVDGDLIESLLDLPLDRQRRVADGLLMPAADESEMRSEATVEELVKLVEDLTRLH